LKKILIVLIGSQSLNNLLNYNNITSLNKNFDCDFLVDKSLNKNKTLIKYKKIINIKYIDISKIANKEISFLEKLLINLFYLKFYKISFAFKKNIFGKNPKKILFLPFLIFSLPFYKFFSKLSLKLRVEDTNLLKIFNQKKYDNCLIMTGGFGNFVLSLINILNNRKINFSIMYAGMDNIYTKVPMFHQPNKIFVWGRHMQNFANKIYNGENIIIGVAQYQNYFQFLSNPNRKNLINKHRIEINKLHNLNHNKKIILYAGPVHPYDETSDLDIISETLDKYNLNSKYQILFRPHPHRKFIKGSNFYNKKYKNIFIDSTVISNYKKSLTKSNSYLDKMTDPYYFVKLLTNIDLIISPLSTMVMEAAIFDKPCVVIGYGGLKNKYLKEALKWDHFGAIQNKKWFSIASNKEELSKFMINQLKTKYKKSFISKDTLNIVDKKTLTFDKELIYHLKK